MRRGRAHKAALHPVTLSPRTSPGWSCNTELYAPIFARLASHGFVVAAPLVTDVLANPFFEEQAVDFKDQTVQLFSAVAWAQHNPAWAGRIDATQLGLGGHSAGGGIAVQAAIEAGVNVTAVATLGGWVNIASTPWLASLAASMSAPAMAVSADFDTRAPTATNAAVLLNASLAPVLLPVVAEGSHCFLDWRPAQAGSPLRESAGAGSPLGSGGRLLPLAGESDCRLLNRRAEPPTCGPSEAEQMAFGATLLTAWFALYLRGDVAAAPLLWGGPSTSAWVSSVQRASRVALELLPANATVVLRAGGATTLPLLRLRNLGPRAGRWSLSAAFAGEGGASALRATLAVPTLHLDASAAAAAAAAAAAVLPRQDALPQIITQMHTPPPRSPPAPPRRWRNSGTGRKLLQGAAGDASGDDAAEVSATLSADAGVVAGKYTLRVSATSGADGGTTAYAFVMVTVSN